MTRDRAAETSPDLPSPRLASGLGRRILAAASFGTATAGMAAIAITTPEADAGALAPFAALDLALVFLALLGRGSSALPPIAWLLTLAFFAGGQLLLAIPNAAGALLLLRPARPEVAPASPELPHRYGRPEAAWTAGLLPLGWSGGRLGALQRGSGTCRWCGAPRDDPRHRLPGEPGADRS